MFKQIESYNKQVLYFSGVKSFWAITDTIKNLNGRNNATSIICYGFSTFYTNIPYGKVIGILKEHIDFCFKGGDGEFIVADRCGAQWSNRQ